MRGKSSEAEGVSHDGISNGTEHQLAARAAAEAPAARPGLARRGSERNLAVGLDSQASAVQQSNIFRWHWFCDHKKDRINTTGSGVG